MGQFHSTKWRASDDRVVACSKERNPRSEIKILHPNKPSNHNTHKTKPAKLHNTIKMTSKQEGIEEDEEMGVQFGSEQPISKPRQPRRVNTGRVNDEIIRQNRDDVTSYTSQSTSIYEQAKNENTFVGEAYYYFLNNKKVGNAHCEGEQTLISTSRLWRQFTALT